jgi:ABC-2 type transport system permease protein
MSGTVFDIGYQSYAGAREGRARSQLAVFKDGVRIALGFGRGGRAKILPWLFIAVLSFIGLIMALIAGAVDRLMGPQAAAQLPSHVDLYGIAAIIIFVFAAVVAPELLCRDRRDGTINLYLVRPLRSTDYILSRIMAFLVVTTVVVWLPQLVLFVGLFMGAPDPLEYLRWHWLDLPRLLGAGLAIAAYVTSLAMLVASFTTRRAYASVFLVGLFVISAPFTVGMANDMSGTVGAWISMFNLTNIPIHVNDIIFSSVSEVTEEAPARELGPTVLVAWYFLWTIGCALITEWRYRRLKP